jgi:hypothetical protein
MKTCYKEQVYRAPLNCVSFHTLVSETSAANFTNKTVFRISKEFKAVIHRGNQLHEVGCI